MNEAGFTVDPLELDSRADLQTVLAAWHTATLRLQQTHDALREEVQNLTEELEVKNRELARKNRLADLGQMASHVAHEVRNNLVPVTLYLSLLRRRVGADRASSDILDKIAMGFTALDAMVHDLLHFTSDRGPQLQAFALDKLVEDLRAALAPQLAAQKITVRIDMPANFSMTADREMIRRAVLNLVLNALDAMPDGGRLTVAASRVQGVQLEVIDNGPGLPEQIVPRIFEPFFTTKNGGTGLGLAIVARIAEVHGGHVTAGNVPGGGAVFCLAIPNAPAATPLPHGTGEETTGAERKRTVAFSACRAQANETWHSPRDSQETVS